MRLTKRYLEYLVAVHAEEYEGIARLYRIAERLGVKLPSARKTLKELETLGLVLRFPGRGYKLTRAGKEVYRKFIWKHRILETYLCRFLNFSPEEACECASHFDAYIPEEVIGRMCELMGHPPSCPHGYEIPHVDHGGEEE